MFTAKSPIQLDSGTGKMFRWWPRHHARMLVPDRGEPTTKIGLLISLCISAFLRRNVNLRLRWPRCSDGLSAHPEAAADPTAEIGECGFQIWWIIVVQIAIRH